MDINILKKKPHLVFGSLFAVFCLSLFVYISNFSNLDFYNSSSNVISSAPFVVGDLTYTKRSVCGGKKYDPQTHQCCTNCSNFAAVDTFTRDLTVGSSGPDVAELQTFLVSKGFLIMPIGVAPGIFGKVTGSAVAEYQIANKIIELKGRGYFGPETRKFVNHILNNNRCRATSYKISVLGKCPIIVGSNILDLSFNSGDDGNYDEILPIQADEYSTDEIFLYSFTANATTKKVFIEGVYLDLVTLPNTNVSLLDLFKSDKFVLHYSILGPDNDTNQGPDWVKNYEFEGGISPGTSTAKIYFDEGITELNVGETFKAIVSTTLNPANEIPDFDYDGGINVTGINVQYDDSEKSGKIANELSSTAGGKLFFPPLPESASVLPELTSTSAKEISADEVGEGDTGIFTIKFKVTAPYKDIYIGVPESVHEKIDATDSISFVGRSAIYQSSGNYKVAQGTTESFTFTQIVNVNSRIPAVGATLVKVQLTSLQWNEDNSPTRYNAYSQLKEYETDTLFLRGL